MASRHSRSVEAAKMWFIPWGMLCLLWLLFVAKLSWYEAFVGIGVLRQLHSGIIADYVTWLTIGWLSWELSRHICSALYREDKPRVDDTAVQVPIIRETSIDFASS